MKIKDINADINCLSVIKFSLALNPFRFEIP